MDQSHQSNAGRPNRISRRRMLSSVAGLAAAGTLAAKLPAEAAAAERRLRKAVTKGRINQSIVPWCWQTSGEKWSLDQICVIAKQLGCKSVELVLTDELEIVKKHGLTCAIGQINMNPDPPFLRGFNNPDNWPRLIKVTRETIDAAAANGVPNVICFTGYSAKNPNDQNSPLIPPDEGAKNSVEGLKQVMGYAEEKKVNLCMELLNTRETTHPMKGHPGYQGDHTDYVIDILKRIGSPRAKMLFDVYHVQIMDGDIIRRIRQCKDYIGHVHVAGNPGRGELDDTQELNFPAIMKTLLEVGYTGFVGQEFIPTRDPRKGLEEAVTLCDV